MTSSFTSYSMLLVSLALVFMFISPSSTEKHTKLSNICSKTTDHHWCMRLMKSDSRSEYANNHDFTEVAIDIAYSKARDIHRDLNSLYDRTRNARKKDQYNSCSKNYHGAIKDLKQIKKLFKDGHYKRIAIPVNDAVEEVRDCKNQLEKSTSDSSHLKRRTKEFELLCDVVKISSKFLSHDS
ncbi:Pectinesterase inhibitor [Camellia lanceoleosa]|uniref:Pectinesterase inhibitor n=1 Tax=Camellia lanceoleosa TaxID=1840588 RepID=A0ACC0FKD9_9ERIC|nr:Pectinesterase inhibitor [Camellia lanceoleosa]